jgi:hypothetical protein
MTPRTATLPILLAGTVFTSFAWADPPPKVCVAVAGDPDEAVRAAAETLSETIGTHRMLRGVADADARAALRGEPRAENPMPELTTARRALRANDRDGALLDPLAEQLGCALFVEVAARPAGMVVRIYDTVAHTWRDAREVANINPATVDDVIVPAALQRGTRPNTPDGGVTNAHTNTATRANTDATAPRSFWSRAWPWVVVGALAAGVVAVYFLAESEVSNTTRITVIHGGAR